MKFQTPLPAFFNFISANLNNDPKALMLKEYGKKHDFDIELAILQIESRRKATNKLKNFISYPEVIFPTSLAYEQSSHESVANYHASLVPFGCSLLDMTAGLGIDSISFASRGCMVTACEMDELKADVLRHNASIMGLDNIKVVNADSTEWFKANDTHFDIIFVDPARRSGDDRRLYNMHDCSPDILKIQDELLSKCNILLIKASPLLDITQTLKDIPHTKVIRVISVAGECKEVLIEAVPNGTLEESVAIDLLQDGYPNFIFSYNPTDRTSEIAFAQLEDIQSGGYLYEPGPAIMKLNPWNVLSARYPGIKKFGVSSHLFAAPTLYKDFPGRILTIDSVIDKKGRKSLKGTPANVVTRNYPIKAEELRKKLGVKEGADQFIYATRLGETPILISATRVRT